MDSIARIDSNQGQIRYGSSERFDFVALATTFKHVLLGLYKRQIKTRKPCTTGSHNMTAGLLGALLQRELQEQNHVEMTVC